MSFDANPVRPQSAASGPDQPLGPETDRGDVVVTRSEEELRIITRRRETQRVRLVKYVETETQTRTVEVRHEQIRMESEPFSETSGEPTPSSGRPAESGEGWLVLYDEEVVVQTRWIARERVRLSTYTVTEDLEIPEDLRSEQIEIDDTTYGG